jgi:hypothetical protein
VLPMMPRPAAQANRVLERERPYIRTKTAGEIGDGTPHVVNEFQARDTRRSIPRGRFCRTLSGSGVAPPEGEGIHDQLC